MLVLWLPGTHTNKPLFRHFEATMRRAADIAWCWVFFDLFSHSTRFIWCSLVKHPSWKWNHITSMKAPRWYGKKYSQHTQKIGKHLVPWRTYDPQNQSHVCWRVSFSSNATLKSESEDTVSPFESMRQRSMISTLAYAKAANRLTLTVQGKVSMGIHLHAPTEYRCGYHMYTRTEFLHACFIGCKALHPAQFLNRLKPKLSCPFASPIWIPLLLVLKECNLTSIFPSDMLKVQVE